MVRAKVVHTWQRLSRRRRKGLRRLAGRARDAGSRGRCEVILALARGTTPTPSSPGGLRAKSPVYRAAVRFLAGGPAGLADRRGDDGQRKITPADAAGRLRLVDQSPQGLGYRRPTRTRGRLISVPAERTEIATGPPARSRLPGRWGAGLKRPKPVVRCPGKGARRRRRAIGRLVMRLPADEVAVYVDEVDIHLDPEIGPDRTG